MDSAKTVTDSPRTIRIGRLEVGLNLIVQIFIWLIIIGMVNYLSSRNFKRFDWGMNKEMELAPMTRSLLENLQKPVQAIVFFSGANPEAEGMAVELLREYEYAAKGKLTMEMVNPEANRTRALELAQKYKFGAAESIVIFDYDGRHKFVYSTEMADMEQRDPMQEMMRRQQGLPPSPPPRMIAFKGESLMTAALLEITEPKQSKIYFISGHGEHDYNAPTSAEGRTLEALKMSLTRQNLQHAELKLAEIDKIPEDANAVAILGPKQDFSERDLKVLTEYWERKGRFLICAGPTLGRTPKLNGWFSERGVTPRGDDVLRVQSLGGMGILMRAGILTGSSPIIKDLAGMGVETDVPIQSLLLDRTKETTAQLRLTELMTAPKDFWGETTPMTGREAPRFDPNVDHAAPLTLGVQVEKGASTDPKVKLETARLVLFGTADIFTDRGVATAQGALDLALNSINWLLSRETLINIAPKAKTSLTYSLTPEQVGTIGVWVMAYIPLGIAIFGLYHLWWRHGRNLFLLTSWLAGAFLALVGLWYLLLLGLGNESARTIPKGLLIALFVAAALGVIATWMHFSEQKKRIAAQK